ncbi:cytochrome ubiquinol oxidase subunit I [Ancylobacter mangrovi]|uniref:cytochrome ubiquinol oxidase subunit I n=1 Tax=Ancylobacter mangrovi TaxID=2972472 RepID=UPI002163CBF0|nr:cytochrome ubiquinol oxidase subunit I [Ancylobacter mangrovi]MCS0502066.1 cytochrome ubiquinol oxidase subunit I [Ancylobacter mangrovi]
MDAVDIARAQFAFTAAFHILWPTFTIGIAWFVTLLSLLWWRTGKTVYRDLMRFWMRIFALGFGMGVITGIVMSYEIGTNWAGYSRAVANVLGPMFMYETLTAFFLEAGFVGIMLFGEGRVSRGAHFFACLMVASGALFSATWIIAANSWMQTPAGAVADANGIFHVVDWWQAVVSPSFPYRLAHMVCASFLTGAFIVAGVSAWHLWRGRHLEASRAAFSLAMWLALVTAPAQIFLGDLQGRNTLKEQPVKLAAMEGLWDTTRGPAMTLIAWPDQEDQRNFYALDIPRLASLYLTHSWDGEVQGLKSVPPSDQPDVPIVFFAFRIMVGIGVLLLATAAAGLALRLRGRLFEARWFQLLTMATTPLGFVAVVAGWTVTEAGRQPWIVYGHLRTAQAISPVSAGAVTASFIGFFVIYNLLLLAFFWFAARVALKGPDAAAPPTRERPGLERLNTTTLVDGAAATSGPIGG